MFLLRGNTGFRFEHKKFFDTLAAHEDKPKTPALLVFGMKLEFLPSCELRSVGML
jgi:hypothetical protein